MEISWSDDGGVAVRLGDLMIFDVPAHDLIRTISRAVWARPSWREDGDNVAFHDLDLGFWRPGPPIDEEPEDEYRNGKYRMTVSLARTGYEREKSDSLRARFGEQELRNRRPPEGFEWTAPDGCYVTSGEQSISATDGLSPSRGLITVSPRLP